MANVVNGHVIARISQFPCAPNIMKMFAELGRLCGHESRIGTLHDIRW